MIREFWPIIILQQYSSRNPNINYNNIIIGTGNSSIIVEGSYERSPANITASFNWWGTNDLDAIRLSIVDKRTDYAGNHPEDWKITYQPIAESFITEALPH